MVSTEDIPDNWETEDVEIVTVDPTTGERADGLSTTGAGPQYEELRGHIKRRPCPECDEGELIYEAPMGVMDCSRCLNTSSPRLQDHDIPT